jgi:hypothetical protein
VTLCGALSHGLRRGADIHGNITRLDNALENFGDTARRLETGLVSTKEQMEATESEVDRSFPQESEYREKSARLKELNVLLKLDEKDSKILETEPDEPKGTAFRADDDQPEGYVNYYLLPFAGKAGRGLRRRRRRQDDGGGRVWKTQYRRDYYNAQTLLRDGGRRG